MTLSSLHLVEKQGDKKRGYPTLSLGGLVHITRPLRRNLTSSHAGYSRASLDFRPNTATFRYRYCTGRYRPTGTRALCSTYITLPGLVVTVCMAAPPSAPKPQPVGTGTGH